MNDYGQINNLWERNLENLTSFAKTVQEESTKAFTNGANTYVEGINMGMDVMRKASAEATKNMNSFGEMWSNAVQTTMNQTTHATKREE